MRKVACIFPEDESTDFLFPIYKQLENLSGFVGYRFNTLDSQKRNNFHDALKQLEDNSLLVFLGHGASNRLYGSVDENGDKHVLFDKDNTKQLTNKDFICIACQSKEFAHYHFQNYIGFGDITSDYSEVMVERNLREPDYLKWASEEDIINFRNEFVYAIADAVKLSECRGLQSVYRMMKLCFNKRIALLLINKHIPNHRQVADMLYDINDEILFKQESNLN